MKIILGWIAAILLTVVSTAQAAPVKVDGAWAAKVPAPNGRMTLDVTFKFQTSGSKLSGTASTVAGSFDLADGKVDGDRISFMIDGDSGKYTGTAAGDEIKMQITFTSGENGTRRWSFVATRITAPRPAPAAIDGTWTADVPRGESRFISSRFVFHSDGVVLTGTAYALDMSFDIVNGTIKGDEIAFNVGETKGDYSGRLVGDHIQMKVRYEGGETGRQTLPFLARRAE